VIAVLTRRAARLAGNAGNRIDDPSLRQIDLAGQRVDRKESPRRNSSTTPPSGTAGRAAPCPPPPGHPEK
jgi:hypothetical protein